MGAAVALIALLGTAFANSETLVWEGRRFGLELPRGYTQTFKSGDSFFFFDPRRNDARGSISVIFTPFDKWPPNDRPSLEDFADLGIWPGRHRGPHDIHERKPFTLDGVPAIKIKWSNWSGRERRSTAVTKPPREWGVTVVAIHQGIGVRLQVTDVEPNAPKSLEAAEKSLATFTFTAKP